MSNLLLSPLAVGNLALRNRIVMAPMTRSRAQQPGDVPTALNALYYAQRAGAGLIVSEGTQISHLGQGYAYTPGIYSEAQLAGWRQVTEAVHAAGGLIAAQLWHVGRMSHRSLQAGGEAPIAPSPIQAKAQVFIADGQGGGSMAPADAPREMTLEDIRRVRDEFVRAARNALDAGFDLVELHGANGYLIDQFLASASNRRSDAYGGSLENRARFLLEIVDALVAAVGAERVGLRLSPWGTINDMHDDEPEAMTLYLAEALQRRGIAYLHLAEWEWSGGPAYPQGFRERLRERFRAPLIVCGNYDAERAEAILQAGLIPFPPMHRSRARPRLRSRRSLAVLLPILLLAAAGFTILTTEFVIVGLLPALAADLQVSVAQAGLLVSLFAFSVAAFGPFLTAALAGVERKRLFVACLLLFAAANALAAVAGDIWTMAVARFVPALALPVFWAMASETAAHLAGPSREGRAVALVFFGIVAATVLGIPIGTLIADAWGWRLAFAALAALALAKALLLAAWLPRIPGRPGISLRSQASVLRQPLVLGHLLLSLLVFTGMFTPYTYLADILQRLAGFSGSLVGWTLMGFGAVGLLGNWLGGRLVDRSPLGATLLFVLLMALGMLALVPTLGNAWLLAATLATWGVAQAALFIVGQVRVMKSAPRAPAFAASLNISACNAGIGIGALAGSRVIDGSGLAPLGEVGALVCLAAMAVALLLMLAPRQAATEPSLGGQIPH